ncbi:Uncharacterised protein [uncultured archaeon]|nr:Uncharacterised protein [uncultured archaeon]
MVSVEVGSVYIVIHRPLPAYVDIVDVVPVHCGLQVRWERVVPVVSVSHTSLPVEPVGFHAKSASLVAALSTPVSMLAVAVHAEPLQYAVPRRGPLSMNTAVMAVLDGSGTSLSQRTFRPAVAPVKSGLSVHAPDTQENVATFPVPLPLPDATMPLLPS